MSATEDLDLRSRQAELLRLLMGHWVSSSLGAAVDLGIADALRAGPLDTAGVGAAVGIAPESAARLLRLLQALDIVDRDDRDRWATTPTGELLRSDHPASLSPLATLYQESYFARAWEQLADGLRCGEAPFTRAHGEPVFDYLATRPQQRSTFSSGMAVGSAFVAELPSRYDFAGRCVVDVGGGDGTLLAAILAAEPTASGRLVDRPDAVAAAAGRLAGPVAAGRCQVMAGDFFAPLPVRGDVLVLSRVLHDWDDDEAGAILRNCRQAMQTGDVLLVIERVLSDVEPSPVAAAFDLHMLVMTSGRERSATEYRKLCAANGFEIIRIDDLPLEMHLVVAEAR